MAKKKLLLVAAVAVAGAALLAAPRIARALIALDAEQQTLLDAWTALQNGADTLPDLSPLLTASATNTGDAESADFAAVRRLAMAAETGARTPDAQKYLLDLATQQNAFWADPNAAIRAGATVPGTRKWASLGPLAARQEFNATYYNGMDSGRPTAIVVHPQNPNLVFLGTSGGGIWVADLSTSTPKWTAITETLGSLAIGAIAIDPNVAADGTLTLWLGLGDAFDQQSGVLVKGTYKPGDTTGVWGSPIVLGTSTHPADGFPSAPMNIRQIRLDPNAPGHILVAADDALYMSTDAGSSFQLIDLPNEPAIGFAPNAGMTREAIWDIAYLGPDAGTGASHWLVSGVYGCPTLPGATVPSRPPSPASEMRAAGITGQLACPSDTNPADYNKGDFWKSTDGGATWVSIRVSGGLPLSVTGSNLTDVGRIAFATGPATDPTTTIVYAQGGSAQEAPLTNPIAFTPAAAAYLKSVDGGSTWTQIATGLTLSNPATTPTAVKNPTFATDAGNGCQSMNVSHAQSFYNLAVAVDPGNPNRAVFGGDLCSAITVDGGLTFSLSSHWLPLSGFGQTSFGLLPYVHADWHVALALRINGMPVLLAGHDGGLSITRDVWDVPTPELSSWTQPDVGLATHMFNGIGTGDPTLGNPNVVFGGTQDNGTRFRLVADEAFIQDLNPGNWDQIIGGDGIGAAVSSDTNGQNPVYWASVNGRRQFCLPRTWDCSRATRIQNGVESPNWRNVGSLSGIADPFLMRFDPLGDDSSGVASASSTAAAVWFINQTSFATSARLVVANNSLLVDGTIRSIRGMGLRVSPYRYTLDGKANTRIYGGVTGSNGPATAGGTTDPTTATGMGSFLAWEEPLANGTFSTGLTVSPNGIRFKGATSVGTGTLWIGNGSDFAAPRNPASLGGTDSKKTWLASSNAVLSNAIGCAGNPVPTTCDPQIIIPASIGHIYKTIDGGLTWTPFHGNGAGFDLPNFPVWVMRYDPSDTTDQIIWVGTEFGVYRTTDGGNTWAPYGSGLPAVRITDIRISNNGSLVRVATYGRGVWEIYPNSEVPIAAGTGDFDGAKVLDFFDVASLAARMGSTPSLNNNLPYDSAVDLDGNSTVDDADLSALVAKFGSTLP